ncbi:SRPBCC family protein [Jongsikchunia kroppenstedtii]|uniref:SRPBCC family protein n=1 Tax=Jongsikchunia kroppenstedtii TaxID=1121721 RepID=UPI0003644620|nr:SRPBCC family protein [Jongsikchunia kroppenstedtii]
MLLRDAPTTEATIKIDATPAAVWDLITDITLPARYSPELQSVQWLDGATEVAVGARFQGNNQNPHIGEWSTTSRIVEVEPQRRLVWQIEGDPAAEPPATWGFEIDEATGGVILRQWARLGPGPSGLSMAIATMPDKEARILERRLGEHRAAMELNLEGIREILEGGGA